MDPCDGHLDCTRPLAEACVPGSALSDSGTLSGGAGGSAPNGNGSGGSPPTGSGGSSGSGVDGNANQCTDACCPTDASCYSNPQAVQNSPGAECLAIRDNTGQPHIQLRQTWMRYTTPKGNTIPAVYNTLNLFTNLSDPACRTPNATSGFLQAMDIDVSDTSDITKNVATVGYATYVTDTAAAKRDGLCLAELGSPGWTDTAYYNGTTTDFSLPASEMSPSADYPPGLPPPMPQPWTFAPTRAKRLTQDFDLATDRQALLAMFDVGNPANIAKDGFSGVFFFDGARGTFHGFSPLSWQLIYDPRPTGQIIPSSYVVVPLREAETRLQFNDPAHPDCVGRFRADMLDPAQNCTLDYSDQTKAPWIGWPGTDPAIGSDKAGEGSATVHGYFLITELEQVYSSVLGSTLCVSYPTAASSVVGGWATSADKRCRAPTNAKTWNPSDPVNGLPMGDWCAATNSPSDANCHDAYRSVSFHAYQGFNVKDGTCTPY